MQGERSRVQGPLPLGQTPGAWLLSWPFLGLPAGPACWPAPPSFLLMPCLSLWKQFLFLLFLPSCLGLVSVFPASPPPTGSSPSRQRLCPGSEATHSHQHPLPFCSFSELFVFA